MKKLLELPLFRLLRSKARQWQKWKFTRRLLRRYRDANEGVTAAIVALMLMAILTLFAFFMNVGALLLTRARLQTMAELGAAGGGRVVAEKIAWLASKNVTSPPPPEDKNKPEKYLNDSNLNFLQTDTTFIQEVKAGVQDYVGKNKLIALIDFDETKTEFVSITYSYPDRAFNDCKGNKKTVDVHVLVNYTYPFMLGKITEEITKKPGINLTATGIYSIAICS